MELSNKASKEGLLSFEPNYMPSLNEEKDFFLKAALQCLLDFTDDWDKSAERVEDILSNLVIADGSAGAELLGRLLIVQFAVSMVRIEWDRLLCYRLLSMLGSEYLKNIEDYLNKN